MDQMHLRVLSGQMSGKAARRFNGAFGRRRVVDGNKETLQPDVAADLTDEAPGAGRNKERWDGCASKHRFRNGSLQPLLKPVTTVRGKHDEVGGMPLEKAGNAAHDVLAIEGRVDDADAELVAERRRRGVFLNEVPLREQAPHMWKR